MGSHSVTCHTAEVTFPPKLAVVDRRLRPGVANGAVTLSTHHFLALRKDITCKHDVMNIQHEHRGLVNPGCKN